MQQAAPLHEPKILDGRWLSRQVLAAVKRSVAPLKQKHGKTPGLGVILVGENPASQTYVANKEKTALECGFETFDIKLPRTATEKEVSSAIQQFNVDKKVSGILLQLPLPEQLSKVQNTLLDQIVPEKDADGLHPTNQGLLMRGDGVLRPCTPSGVMKLIDLAFTNIDSKVTAPENVPSIPQANLAGKKAIVIGRSILVGKPCGLMLLERNATVVMAHSKSPDLPALCREADIVVAAVGVPRLVKGDWIKPGAVVIDVGINRQADGKLCGDVEYEGALKNAAAITPVPGGVGPMTIAVLLQNTFQSFLKNNNFQAE